MSIFVNKETRVICQGITGTQATFHVRRSLDYGTKFVSGVTPGKGGEMHLGLPVFNTVKEAKAETGANASVLYVPAAAVKSAVREAAEAELDLAVCIADGVPIKDMLEIKEILKDSPTRLIGPNTPGIITPGQARLGIFPENIHNPGAIGVVSRSSTLTYEAVLETKRAGQGQSTVIGLGDDMLIGIDFVEAIERFHADEETRAIVLIGQLGGTFEEVAAKYYKEYNKAKTAESILTLQLEKGRRDLDYLNSVLEAIALAEGERDLQEIRQELTDTGYLRRPSKARDRGKRVASKPMEFRSSSGLRISVGKNNTQNDLLTTKQAFKSDLWFHTQKIHGSHVILWTEGGQPDLTSIQEAAQLAAWFSQGRESGKVAVDYTPVKYVKKPGGARPGMVVYTTYETAYVAPDGELARRLRVK